MKIDGSNNSIIVSGTSLIADTIMKDCVICDYDVLWAINYPSTLIWADNIIITPTIYNYIQKEQGPYKKDIAKVVSTYFNVANEYGIVNIRNPRDFLPNEAFKSIQRQANAEFYALTMKEEDYVTIGKHRYFWPDILSLYVSLALARVWNANPILDQSSKRYLSYQFENSVVKQYRVKENVKAFSEVFKQQIPEINIKPPVFKECNKCKNLKHCTTNIMGKHEKTIRDYIKLREYDEIQQMKAVFRQISERVDTGATSKEIIAEFKGIQNKLAKQFSNVFPKVMRWSKLFTIVSVPVIISGLTFTNPLVAGIGAGIAGISTVVEKYVDYLHSKNRWVCFSQSK